MSRLMKEINRAARLNDLGALTRFGAVEFCVSKKHLTARNGKIIHNQKGK